MKPFGREAVRVAGDYPRCEHSIAVPLVMITVGMAGTAPLRPQARQDGEKPLAVQCNCSGVHEGQGKNAGCGARFAIWNEVG